MTIETVTLEEKQAKVALTVISMLHRRADGFIKDGDSEIKKFVTNLQGDSPAHAFQWAHGVMSATAARDVALYIKTCLTAIPSETNIWALRESVNDRVISSAKYPSFSTSATTNLMEQFKLAAFAEWASLLNQAIVHLEAEGIHASASTTDEA